MFRTYSVAGKQPPDSMTSPSIIFSRLYNTIILLQKTGYGNKNFSYAG